MLISIADCTESSGFGYCVGNPWSDSCSYVLGGCGWCVLYLWQGVALCTKLEELTVDRNLLESAAGVGRLVHLKWLSLSSNCLTQLPLLHDLTQLTYFNFTNNSVTSLTNLKVCYVSLNALLLWNDSCAGSILTN